MRQQPLRLGCAPPDEQYVDLMGPDGQPDEADDLVAGALRDEEFQRTAGKLDPGTRLLVTAFLKMALPRLVRVRRPRDLRRWTKDAVVLAATHSYLVPAIDGLMESAARGALPIRGRVPSHLSATVTGVAGPVAANLAELQVLAATILSGPGGAPVAAVSAPTAAAVGVAAQMAELYAQTSVAARILAGHGITDPVALRTVMARALVPGGSEMAVRVATRLATRMITRLAVQWLPVVSIARGLVVSNVDMHRIHQAARNVAREW